ncbi:pilin [Seongchinamella unica]|uniref:Pilin n=1 Tax=Seongchinamella unica TaxID=2547392 RepID=A0A4R5LP88_9GAMM|nr:pilin [Seongchinamella unica]TDG12165.1 pilin [Seongchinamella unica]
MNTEAQAPRAPGCTRAQAGFTVIELMIVVTIVSILAVIAMPAYVEYATRSKVSEAMGFMGEAKTSVSEYFYTNGYEWPTNNSDAGLPDPADYDAYDFVKELMVTVNPVPGTISITLDLPNTPADNKQLQLVPSTSTGEIVWTCRPAPAPDGVENKYAPANCRI